MKLHFEDGSEREVDPAEHIILAIPGRESEFDVSNGRTWEADRAWVFAIPGRTMWLGGTVLKRIQMVSVRD